MKTMVIYFSPTGGTKQVAQLIADKLGGDMVDITVFNNEMHFTAQELLFFCFPVYGGRIPSPMYDRMAAIHGEGTPAVQVAVYGNRAVEDALVEMSDLCQRQGFRTVGGCEMIAPHAIDRSIGAGRPDARDVAQLNLFLRQLTERPELKDVSLPGNHDYRKYDGIPFRPVVSKDCTECGTCSMECPAGAIDPCVSMSPDKDKCISCMRCVSICPFGNRKLPKAMQLAAAVYLRKECMGRKEPKFYL